MKNTACTRAVFLYPHLSCTYTPRGVYSLHMQHDRKKRMIRRLKIMEGQLRGLQDMIARDVYCIDVITQTSAVKQGLSTLEDMLLEGHLGHCAVQQIKQGKEKKAVEEILKVYKLKRK